MLTLTCNGIWTQFVAPLRELTPFRTHGNLYAHAGPCVTRGRLPHGDQLVAMNDSLAKADYVVYSYATPIAWHVPAVTEVKVAGYSKEISGNDFPFATGTWVFPPFRYSVTTSKAQGKILTALSYLGFFK